MKHLSNGKTFLNQKYYAQFIGVWRRTLISPLAFQPEPISEWKNDFSLAELKSNWACSPWAISPVSGLTKLSAFFSVPVAGRQPHMPQDQDLTFLKQL